MKHGMTYAALLAATLTVPETAFAARNGYQTVGLNNTDFEVIPRARTDVDGYWCAAADFARRTLGAGWQQQIYVVRGYGPSQATGRKTSVLFSIKPPAGVEAQVKPITAGFTPGQSRSVQSANALCNRRQLFD